ncbi:hypothetical protein L9F63_008066, partial [Diploptera punctata]
MSIQQFCLRWNNHQPNFISVFTNLLTNSTLVDVTLAAEGKHLQAHKVVLSACSTYFQSLFQSSPCQHPIVILKDVKYNDLKTMVDFMYYGEVNVSQDQLPAILKTAEMLKIKGLAEMPESNIAGSVHMSKSLSVSSDKAELLTPSESGWGPDSRCSPAPLSPSMRRKRLRKSSTGSGSGSTGLQWTLLEHGYPRFALSSCQSSLSVQTSSAFCAPEPPSNSSPMSKFMSHRRKRSINPQADENFLRALEARPRSQENSGNMNESSSSNTHHGMNKLITPDKSLQIKYKQLRFINLINKLFTIKLLVFYETFLVKIYYNHTLQLLFYKATMYLESKMDLRFHPGYHTIIKESLVAI